jgi:hypothetical protein
MFRLAGLASISLVPIELEMIFVPFWESRIKFKIMLTRVRRTLRDGLLPEGRGFPFKKGAKESSTGLLDFARFKTEVERSNGLKTFFLFFSIFAQVRSLVINEPFPEGLKEGLSVPSIPLVEVANDAKDHIVSSCPFFHNRITRE